MKKTLLALLILGLSGASYAQLMPVPKSPAKSNSYTPLKIHGQKKNAQAPAPTKITPTKTPDGLMPVPMEHRGGKHDAFTPLKVFPDKK